MPLLCRIFLFALFFSSISAWAFVSCRMDGKKVELVRTWQCMAHEVFISHSSLDKPVADAVCAALEKTAIRCWIAPRDLQPGRSFAGEITRAIQHSKITVRIFSAHSNTSEQTLREVQVAANSHLHIFQFRFENVLPNEDLEYISALRTG